MIKQLKEALKNEKFVSVYTNAQDTLKFIFGRILCVNDDYIVIYMISPNGEYDGVIVKETEDVIRLEMDDQYSRKMKMLCAVTEEDICQYVVDENQIVKSVLMIAEKTKKIISCELLGSGFDDVVGFVSNLEDGVCEIKQVDSYGCEDGVSYIMVDDISQLSFDSEDEQRILTL